MGTLEDQEELAVRHLGDAIGYGRMMQLAEQIWTQKDRIGAHTVGPCAYNMIRCPHPEKDENGHCEWCCGTGRVTKRVFAAMPRL